jgi:hypothetical protein
MSTRYICTNDICRKTINAHNRLVLDQLPLYLQAEFPALLTHRSAISKTLANWMRPLAQNSVSLKRLVKLLTEMHMLRYSRLELQYLNAIKYRQESQASISSYSQRSMKAFSTFGDMGQYAGFIPSMSYLRTLYTAMMDEMRPMIDKQIMLLGGKFLKGDHSFKIIKKIAKIKGNSAFTAMYTVCNEFEEVRMQLLVPSKSLMHLQRPFESMRDAYNLYGFEQPQYFFTDNVRSDRNFLTTVLPSLKCDASGNASSYEDLGCVDISGFQIHHLWTTQDIDHGIEPLLAQSLHHPIFIGISCDQKQISSGQYCRVCIAYDLRIFVVHIQPATSLPCSLLNFVQSDSVIKMGRQLTAEFRMLERFLSAQIRGSLEIGTFCRERNAIESSFSSLADICVETTGCRLPNLMDFQLNAVSLLEVDLIPAINRALCSLLVYRKVQGMPVVGRRLFGEPQFGTDIAVFAPGTSLPAALGKVISVIESISRGQTKVQVNISKVLVPGMILDSEGLTLQDLGSPPFNATLFQDMLRTWINADADGTDIEQDSREEEVVQPMLVHLSDDSDVEAEPTNNVNAETSTPSRYRSCK